MKQLERFLYAESSPPPDPAHLFRETCVAAPLAATFGFFSDSANLQAITPPWLNFRVLGPDSNSTGIGHGVEIRYQISLYGVPIPWRSRIDVWEPGVRFVDRQVLGPYRWWRHEHRFEPVPGGTRVIDCVDYVPRARWISASFVRRDLDRIFDYRQGALERVFGGLRGRDQHGNR